MGLLTLFFLGNNKKLSRLALEIAILVNRKEGLLNEEKVSQLIGELQNVINQATCCCGYFAVR